MSPRATSIIVNLLAYQTAWFACVLAGANGVPWLGTLLALVIVAWHLTRAPYAQAELGLIVAVAMIGAAWDSVLVAAGWLVYPSGTLVAGTAPHWIVAIWMVFATTLNVALRWLQRHRLIAAACGAVAGPLAFLAGAGLGGVTFAAPLQGLVALAAGWAVLTPLVLTVARCLDGFRPAPRPAALGGSG